MKVAQSLRRSLDEAAEIVERVLEEADPGLDHGGFPCQRDVGGMWTEALTHQTSSLLPRAARFQWRSLSGLRIAQISTTWSPTTSRLMTAATSSP